MLVHDLLKPESKILAAVKEAKWGSKLCDTKDLSGGQGDGSFGKELATEG